MRSSLDRSIGWFPTRTGETAALRFVRRIPAKRFLIASSVSALILGGCNDIRTEHLGSHDTGTDASLNGASAEGVAPATGPSSAIVRAGDKAREAGDLSGAIQLYRRAILFEVTSIIPLVRLADALRENGQINDAIDAYDEALDRTPQDGDALRGLGNALIGLDQPTLALEKFDQVIAANPNDVRALNSAGVALDKLGRYAAAQDSYRKALVIDRDNATSRGNLGLSLAFAGDYEGAIKTLQPLAMAPDADARARQNYALVLGLAGRMDEAAEISRIDLDEESVQQNLGYYEILRGTTDQERRVDAIAVNAGGFQAPVAR